MIENLPLVSGVHFEQSPERLKAVFPLRRRWPYLIIYSAMALLWLVLMIGGIIFTLQIAFSGERYAIVFAIMLLIMLFILFRFGRFLWRQWAHFTANREILFINREELIIRRPISIWGNTDAYDMMHVSPFYESEKPKALAFNYGHRRIYLAEDIAPQARSVLRRFLNEQYFPGQEDAEAP